MIGIGINLDDLGIDGDPDFTRPRTQLDEGYPKEYDFALDLHIHGSWRQMRDALYPIAEKAFRGKETPFLGFTLHWAAREDGDTEESIEAALTGLKYDKAVHEAFEYELEGWGASCSNPEAIRQAMAAASGSVHESFLLALAENEDTPQDVLQMLIQEPAARYGLLSNSSVDPQMVRDLYELTKDEPVAAEAFIHATIKLPSDVIEVLVMGDYPRIETNTLVRRVDLTEQALIGLIGKCDRQDIRFHPACTKRVDSEIDRVTPSGGALTPEQRARTLKALRKVRTAIKTGRMGSLVRGKISERALLESVDAYPAISVGLATLVLKRCIEVNKLHRNGHYLQDIQEPWLVAELAALGVPIPAPNTIAEATEWMTE